MKITQLIHFSTFAMRERSGRSSDFSLSRRIYYMSLASLFICLLTTGNALGSGYNKDQTADVVIGLGSLNGPNGFRITGRSDGDQAGRSLRNAGDINGDGLDDFIIGAPSASPNGTQSAGEAYVILGRAANPSSLSLNDLDGSNGFRVSGLAFNDEVGYAVSGAGDVNKDGYDDLIIGAPGVEADDDIEDAGAAYVIFGRATFPAQLNLETLNGTNGFRIDGIVIDARTGAGVAQAGDINGDGYDDMLIGAPEATVGGKEWVGQAFAVMGRHSFPPVIDLNTLNGSDGFLINGVAAESSTGKILRSAGDLNQDGYDDIAVVAGSYLTGRSLDTGTIYIIFGQPNFTAKFNLSAINGSNGFKIEGIAKGDNAGRSIASAGDVNGDGRFDLVIGAPYAAAHMGEAYVVFGQSSYSTTFNLSSLNGSNGFRLVGNEANGEAGTAVGAADVNGDGLEDLIIGASTAGTGSMRFSGKTYVVLGRTTFDASLSLDTLGDGGFRLDGAVAGDQTGQTISSAGDMNGDGYDEFLIGAPNAGPGVNNDTGYTYLIQGGPTLGISLPVTHPGTPNVDSLTGTSGDDVMLAHRGNDQVDAGAGQDVLKGGAGNDVLIGGMDADRLLGGTGQDTASYAGSPGAVSINLFTGVATGGNATGDSLRSIERVIGSPLADTLVGDSLNNWLEGAGGDDTFTGRRGNDTFYFRAGSGDDIITDFTPGPESDDVLDFSARSTLKPGDLTVQAQEGDTLISLPGGDSILLKNVAPASLHADDYRFSGMPLAKPDYFSTSINTPLKVNLPGVLGNDDNPSSNPLTAVLVESPAHGKVTLQANGGFTYTPDNEFVGIDEFTYKADNGLASNVARVTIDVTLVPPTAVDDSYTVAIGETLIVPAPGILGNDKSPGQLPLEAILIGEPIEGVVTLNANGSFSYTSSFDYSAQDSFTYQASNGLSSNTATVVITILDPNGPPVAVDDAYELNVDETLTIPAPGVLANDVDPLSGVMTAKIGAKPSHGEVTLNADGAFTYVPDEGYAGVDSFTYQAGNGQLSNVATVNLKIKGPTDGQQRILLPTILRN
ncbi:MAG: FG-GAP repeat protein [Anaerolineales bacterium]|nr:FG-GAP repeat protein [Anaerolineales bacterium]